MGRLFHFSDIHFGIEHKGAVAAALEHAHTNPRDLVLITGDITQQGFRREFAAAAEWIRAMPEPVFVTTGNHDVSYWDPIARIFHPWKRFEAFIGHPAVDHQFEAPGLSVRGVNTARGWQMRLNWSKGVIDLEQTRRAAMALANGASPRQHHNHSRTPACISFPRLHRVDAAPRPANARQPPQVR